MLVIFMKEKEYCTSCRLRQSRGTKWPTCIRRCEVPTLSMTFLMVCFVSLSLLAAIAAKSCVEPFAHGFLKNKGSSEHDHSCGTFHGHHTMKGSGVSIRVCYIATRDCVGKFFAHADQTAEIRQFTCRVAEDRVVTSKGARIKSMTSFSWR